MWEGVGPAEIGATLLCVFLGLGAGLMGAGLAEDCGKGGGVAGQELVTDVTAADVVVH